MPGNMKYSLISATTASSLEHIVSVDHEKQFSLKQKVGFLTSDEFFTDSFVDKF